MGNFRKTNRMMEAKVIVRMRIPVKKMKMLTQFRLAKMIPMNQIINYNATHKVMRVSIFDGKIIMVEEKPDRMLSHDLKLELTLVCSDAMVKHFYDYAEKKEYSCLGEILHDDIMYYELEILNELHLTTFVGSDKNDRVEIKGRIKLDRDYTKLQKEINNG